MKKKKGRDLTMIWIEKSAREKLKERANKESKSLVDLINELSDL